jgi:hypothetical protein
MKQIDIGGTLFLIDDESGRYRYTILDDGEWRILIRDDGYRLESIHIGEKPVDPPAGKREWELLWSYKSIEAPGLRVLVDQVMKGESAEAEREALDIAIVALQMILSRQRAIRGLPYSDEKVFSVAYFAINHLGKLDQEPDPKIVERIRAATSRSDS